MKNEPDYPEIVHWAQYFPADENKLGNYLKQRGDPIACRLDFRITTLEELKKCCVIVSNLNKAMQKFAYEVEGDKIIRVMLARQTLGEAQHQLKYIDSCKAIKRDQEKQAALDFVNRAEQLEQTKRDQESAMNGIGFQRAKDIAELKAKQAAKVAKAKPVIDLGNVDLGILPKPVKGSRIVELANKKRAAKYG